MRIAVELVRIPEDEEIAVIARWHVADGSRVQLGELLAEVEVGKATIEVTSPATGVLEISEPEGIEFNVDQALAFIDSDN
jgi:pyruvate/2-oxoglutarate dehydrogenase complex dihydrolipoamide acyltransferase (E2) component